MKTKIRTYLFIIMLLVVFICGFAVVPSARAAEPSQEAGPGNPTDKNEASPTTDVITSEEDGGMAPVTPMNVSQLTTDFEAGEGFSPGYCAQNGWTAFTASSAQGEISTANPQTGSQHLQIAYDPSVSRGTYVGCFSPNIGSQTVGPAWMEIDIAISNTGGADYYVVAQSPSQGLVTFYVDFRYLGNIYVLDRRGSHLQWVNTGQAWNIGSHSTLRVEIDPAADTIQYYYDETLIYTGSVFAGTTIEQIVFFSDNWNFGDVADFDSLQAYAGNHPTSINLVSFQSHTQANPPSWIIPTLLVALLIPGAAIIRRYFQTAMN